MLGQVDALEELVDRNVPVDMRLPDNVTSGCTRTALMYACIAACPPAVKALLERGADPNLRDPRGVTPLIFGCAAHGDAPVERRVAVAKLLIDAKAHVDARDSPPPARPNRPGRVPHARCFGPAV